MLICRDGFVFAESARFLWQNFDVNAAIGDLELMKSVAAYTNRHVTAYMYINLYDVAADINLHDVTAYSNPHDVTAYT